MSFKEVNELRKSGKLKEALQVATHALNTDPDNIWNKRAVSWVYYEYLKRYSHPETFDVFKENLLNLKELNLPEDEKMVFDNCVWQIGRLIFAINKTEPINYAQIDELYSIIQDFHFTKPSEAYSFLYKAFHKGYQNWSNFLNFADWWNFDYFNSEDYLSTEYEGRKIMSIVEQAYIAYSKKLLEGDPVDAFGYKKEIDKEKIKTFLPKLDLIIDRYPAYQYPPYFKAKLLLLLGDDENVLSAFLPFAKQRQNDFWVWEIMAEIFSEDQEIQFACLCKALSLRTPEGFLVKIRQKFAGILIEREMYDEAKTEIITIVNTRKENGWGIPRQLLQWAEEDWYKPAKNYKNNNALYSKHLQKAEEILFQDIPEELIVVEFVNRNKNILSFVKDRQKHGFFNYSEKLTNPEIGDLLKVRFRGDAQEGFHRIVTARKAESDSVSSAVKDFRGFIKVISPHNFGFVDDVFVIPDIINDNNIKDGQIVEGTAIMSFNKKKGEWGWKAIRLI